MTNYLEELVQKITTKADLKGFDDLDRKQRRAIKTNDILGQSIRRAFGIFFGIQGIRSIIQTSREFDLLQRSISGLTGSTQDWEYLRKEAYRTGTDLTKAAGAYKNFYSAANMAGFDKDAIQGMFSDVLTAGRGIGANQQQIGAALLALEQMLSKGRVSMEELRRQMGNALPGAFEIAAKAMGVTTQEFNEMLEAGLDSVEFVPRFTKALKENLGQGFEANVKSLDAALVNLNTAWREFQANILQGDVGEVIAQLVNDITRILRNQELLNFIKLIGKALELVIKNIKLIILLFGAKKVIEWTQSIIRLHNAILLAAQSTAQLGTVTRTLATGYMLMTSGQVITGLRMLSVGLWAMVKPIAAANLAMVGLVSWFLILQDLWLFFTDPNADTMTRRLMQGVKDIKEAKENLAKTVTKPLTTEQKDIAVEYYRKQGMQPTFKMNKEGEWELQKIQDIKIPAASIYASPSSSSGTFNSSSNKEVNNNLTINISAPNSQPETIAQSVEDALTNFFKTYKESYA